VTTRKKKLSVTRGHTSDDDRNMTLRHHVQELTRRFLFLFSILLVTSSLVHVYRSSVIPILLHPLDLTFGDQKLMYLNPAGGFNFIFLVSIYAGLAAVAPFLIQQLYLFIRPSLPKAAQKLSVKLLLMSFVLMIAGILFGYFIAVPGALKFLNEFAGDYVSAALTAESYLNFLIAYTLGLGLLFQLPFIVIIGHYIKPFTPTGLMKSERWAIVLIFIAAAIITPTPDPINLLVVALPIILIYQLGVGSVLISIYKKKRLEDRQTKTAPKAQSKPTPVVRQLIDSAPPTADKVVSLTEQHPLVKSSRSVDGFVRPTRTSIPHVHVPSRSGMASVPQPPSRQVIVNEKNSLPRRYLDGVSVLLPQ
jgi:sec-independent protein translocase protein TatC